MNFLMTMYIVFFLLLFAHWYDNNIGIVETVIVGRKYVDVPPKFTLRK